VLLGELSATCKGPSKPALCQLQDQRDGTFLLKVTPQEAGNHLLRVTFNGEAIPGDEYSMSERFNSCIILGVMMRVIQSIVIIVKACFLRESY